MKNNKAFTIIEISIVLLVIGFIIGSTMIGTSLTDRAKTKRALRDLISYQNAFLLFKEQYNAFPGDMVNAVTILGATTSNGNGDGIISCTGAGDECWKAFQHLSLANYVAGSYNGTNQGPQLTTLTPIVIQTYSSNLYLYNVVHTIGNWGDTLVSHAQEIDNKIDDNIPNKGTIAGLSGSNPLISPACVQQSNGSTDLAYNYTGTASGLYNTILANNLCTTLLIVNLN
jgi:type II secretory pathway pseudopilin PulG